MTKEVNAGRLLDFCLSIKLGKLENPLAIQQQDTNTSERFDN